MCVAPEVYATSEIHTPRARVEIAIVPVRHHATVVREAVQKEVCAGIGDIWLRVESGEVALRQHACVVNAGVAEVRDVLRVKRKLFGCKRALSLELRGKSLPFS